MKKRIIKLKNMENKEHALGLDLRARSIEFLGEVRGSLECAHMVSKWSRKKVRVHEAAISRKNRPERKYYIV